MSKVALCVAVALVSWVAAAKAETYEVESWPGDIASIPCSAWTKLGDGGWALKGSLKISASIVDNVGVKGDAAAHYLDRHCGK
jgi:hypothetical protein